MDTRRSLAVAVAAVAFTVASVPGPPPACPVNATVISAPRVDDCSLPTLGSVEVSADGGLGQLAVRGDVAAVVQRDEGVVALVDVADPTAPTVLGRYHGGTGVAALDDPLDGDVAFSDDGTILFHARQTNDYSNEGLHVLDVTDPTAPVLTDIELQGGMLRVAYARVGDTELVATQDAIGGLTLYEVVRSPLGAQTVPVYADVLPGLHVGGPASAGLEFVLDDPLGTPLLYASDGTTGLRVYDVTDPTAPGLLWSTGDAPLAAIAVEQREGRRLVHAAAEYWFEKTRLPELVTYELADDGTVTEVARRLLGVHDGSVAWKLGGLELGPEGLHVADGHGGVLTFDTATERVVQSSTDLGDPTFERAVEFGFAGWYAMDVTRSGDLLFATDAVTGELRVFDASVTAG